MANNQIKKERIVIKIGSSSLTCKTGQLSLDKLNSLVEAIVDLKNLGHEVILVSSGAVAAGFNLLGYPTRPNNIEGKQAAAAVGQGLLIQAYNDAFAKHNYITAQVLITRNDFTVRKQYNNAYNTLNELLKRNAIPIINENDTVAIDELTFGDNDMLSALVAGLLHADKLVILTDTDGLYNLDPRYNKNAVRFEFVKEITPEIMELAKNTGSAYGTGGMKSKINAAKLALSLGSFVFIGTYSGKLGLIDAITGKGKGTYFGEQSLNILKTKKQWIGFHSNTNGLIVVDDGAAFALLDGGRSLLPAGIRKVLGDFSTGKVVEVASLDGVIIGKGLVNYSSDQIKKVLGFSSKYARELLNIDQEEVIHRDNWVTLNEIIKGEVFK